MGMVFVLATNTTMQMWALASNAFENMVFHVSGLPSLVSYSLGTKANSETTNPKFF